MTNFQHLIKDLIEADFLGKRVFQDADLVTITETIALRLLFEDLLKQHANGNKAELSINNNHVVYKSGTHIIGWVKKGADYKVFS
ncbi:hypothetical protein M4D55_10520 [Metabacillus idriensis]|uniref:hypothetical protein n=1 Tax=Metabacillus idriensis TaxID=324768 RepID=UPI00203E6DFA|nr:hypothetical protein [Metabacillus idriensis]MCM3596208.1 hypothetical protein [Metabacillus idriensis]